MKKIFIPIVLVGLIFSGIFFNGCYTDTYDALKTFTFQLPLFFESHHYDRQVPDSSFAYSNLYKYKDYRDNEGRITEAFIVSFNYRIDAIKLDGDVPQKGIILPEHDNSSGNYFHPLRDTLEFEFIRFNFYFAKYKWSGAIDYQDTNRLSWEIDYERTEILLPGPNKLLGEFRDVNVSEYYRKAHNIIEVNQSTAQIISNALKNEPVFYIMTEYSKIKGQEEEKHWFPYVGARYDMVIRFSIDL